MSPLAGSFTDIDPVRERNGHGPPRRHLALAAVLSGFLLMGVNIILQQSDKLLSIPDVGAVNVIGLTAGGAVCGAALAGIIVNLVAWRAGRERAGPAA